MTENEIKVINRIYFTCLSYNPITKDKMFLMGDKLIEEGGYFSKIHPLYMEYLIKKVSDPSNNFSYFKNENDILKYLSKVVRTITSPLIEGKFKRKYSLEIRIDTVNNKKVLTVAYSFNKIPIYFASGIFDKSINDYRLIYSMYSRSYMKQCQDIYTCIERANV